MDNRNLKGREITRSAPKLVMGAKYQKIEADGTIRQAVCGPCIITADGRVQGHWLVAGYKDIFVPEGAPETLGFVRIDADAEALPAPAPAVEADTAVAAE